MKEIVALIACVLAITASAAEENGKLIPDITVPTIGGKLVVRGFANMGVSSDKVTSEVTWRNLRITSDYSNGMLLLHNVINFADMQTRDGNWLREATVGLKLNDNLTISGGRLFIAGGLSMPGPATIETINSPLSDPFNCYAYGVQAMWKNESWTIAGDVSGKSGLSFSDEDNFGAVEASAFVQRKFESGSAINLTTQLSRDFQRYGLGGKGFLNADKTVQIRGELYSAINRDHQTSNMVGGYVFVGWQATDWLELYGQLDHRQFLSKEWTETTWSVDKKTYKVSGKTETKRSSGEGLTTILFGASAKIGENVTLRGNVEFPTDGSTSNLDPTFQGLVQVQF